MPNWYNLPTYYDISFSHEMHEELVFLKNVFKKYRAGNSLHLLEPACGTGRLIVPLSRFGYQCTGFDINNNALNYLNEKLNRNNLVATLFHADMVNFPIKPAKFDGAYCTVDTFRHLLSEKHAVQHLKNVAKGLKKNAIYVIGLHLYPKQGITNKLSRWTSRRGQLTVKTSMTLIGQDRKKRTETLSVILKADTKTQSNQYESVYKLRTYTLNELYKLVSKTKVFEIESIFDYDYDLSRPVVLDEKSDYGVFILRKVK